MNEPPPLRNHLQAGSRRHGVWTRNGLNQRVHQQLQNTLTGAKLADAAFFNFLILPPLRLVFQRLTTTWRKNSY
jgi:hypothetical protein